MKTREENVAETELANTNESLFKKINWQTGQLTKLITAGFSKRDAKVLKNEDLC